MILAFPHELVNWRKGRRMDVSSTEHVGAKKAKRFFYDGLVTHEAAFIAVFLANPQQIPALTSST
jgi:hypothetical protein